MPARAKASRGVRSTRSPIELENTIEVPVTLRPRIEAGMSVVGKRVIRYRYAQNSARRRAVLAGACERACGGKRSPRAASDQALYDKSKRSARVQGSEAHGHI